MVDTVVRNGKVCTSRDSFEADIAIHEGKIVAIGKSPAIPEANEIIDVKGKYVIPGLLHTHCHFRDPGFTHKEDFESGHRCAAAGGITFTIDQANTNPSTITAENWYSKKEIAEKKAIVDYNLYAGAAIPEEIPKLGETGTIGFKMFNTLGPRVRAAHVPDFVVQNHGLMHELYEAVAKTGLPILVHHDDPDWVKWMVEREYLSKGKTTPGDFQEAYQRGIIFGHGMIMGLAVSLYIAKLTGVRLFVSHVGLADAYDMELIRHARSLGQTVYAEMELAPFMIGKEKADRYGPYVSCWGKDPAVAWDWIKKGWVDVALIEHAPQPKEEVEPGWKDMWNVAPPLIATQELLPLMLTNVNKGNLSLHDLIRVTSESPAKIFGLYPMKGAIQVGSDADLTIVDMEKEQKFTKEMVLSKSGWTFFDGDTFKGWPVQTIVRGKTVMKDGTITGKPGQGKFIPRNYGG
jgi:dihydroorotase (multifunctional complex type)